MRVQPARLVALADRLHGQMCCPPCAYQCQTLIPTGPPDPMGERSADMWVDAFGVEYDPEPGFWSSWANPLPILEVRTSDDLRQYREICRLEGNLLIWLDQGEQWVDGAFSRLETVTGNVTIVLSSGIEDFGSSFSQLRTVDGTVWLEGNGDLLSMVTASQTSEDAMAQPDGSAVIESGPRLTSLGTAFESLRTVGANVWIKYNYELSSLGTAFGALQTVGAGVDIESNTALTDLGTAFGSLCTTGAAFIHHNDTLARLGSAFSQLKTANGPVSVSDNGALTNFDMAFLQLETVGGSLTLEDNSVLASLDSAFGALRRVGDDVVVDNQELL